MNDLKFAFRQLLKNPGFTTVDWRRAPLRATRYPASDGADRVGRRFRPGRVLGIDTRYGQLALPNIGATQI